MTDTLTPNTRRTAFLAAWAGEDVELPPPQSPEEFYLAKLAGEDVELPPPNSPTTLWLQKIIDGGGGGGGGKTGPVDAAGLFDLADPQGLSWPVTATGSINS